MDDAQGHAPPVAYSADAIAGMLRQAHQIAAELERCNRAAAVHRVALEGLMRVGAATGLFGPSAAVQQALASSALTEGLPPQALRDRAPA